jgi:iron complex transport system substrate-binding protein
MKRIVTLLPSATEIVVALGLKDQLVGVSHSCDYPSFVRELPILTKTKVDSEAPSEEIDRVTRSVLNEGGSLYEIDEPLLKRLQPDAVITQALCDVCAVNYESVARVVGSMAGVSLVSLEPGCVEDIFQDILRVGAALDVDERANAFVAALRSDWEDLKAATDSLERPRVLSLEWFDPPYFGGHWVPEQIEAAGGISVLGASGERSRAVSWEQIAELDPDVIICMPCGYGTKETRERLREVENDPRFSRLRAVRNESVWCVDASSYFSRPSPRVVTGARLLAHILHGDSFSLPLGVETPIWVCAAR